MAIIKFAVSELLLSCEIIDFRNYDKIGASSILSSFSGSLTRIAVSSTRAESSHLKIETDE